MRTSSWRFTKSDIIILKFWTLTSDGSNVAFAHGHLRSGEYIQQKNYSHNQGTTVFSMIGIKVSLLFEIFSSIRKFTNLFSSYVKTFGVEDAFVTQMKNQKMFQKSKSPFLGETFKAKECQVNFKLIKFNFLNKWIQNVTE